ncbi:hypothetical protein M427DRAFT_147882 [Gonapodya prolifera JEL478]|uniref:Uncharacterized protein n=1 Tax=Gonapodya prolifera (strain JEL478) TaxID=1344416 RepID=A0A139A3J4_GONPJ|nr:hypothetical protein M427DRAFT_147882 [Gonapodya prolifera JEL478]|eukprot:KXS11387.1 hypothetical protein M427DRAFT_147882 [Gonapodya prolifera JEL478]
MIFHQQPIQWTGGACKHSAKFRDPSDSSTFRIPSLSLILKPPNVELSGEGDEKGQASSRSQSRRHLGDQTQRLQIRDAAHQVPPSLVTSSRTVFNDIDTWALTIDIQPIETWALAKPSSTTQDSPSLPSTLSPPLLSPSTRPPLPHHPLALASRFQVRETLPGQIHPRFQAPLAPPHSDSGPRGRPQEIPGSLHLDTARPIAECG